MARLVEFYYDITCPYSYISTYAIRSLLASSLADVQWKPVHLGALSQTSASKDVMFTTVHSSKARWMELDLRMTIERLQVPFQRLPKYVDRGRNAQSLLASIDDNKEREKLSLALYEHYWQHDGDIQDVQSLQDIARKVGLAFNVKKQLERGEDQLVKLNEEAGKRGVNRLPSFYVSNKLYRGVDRVHFVERAVGNSLAEELRLASPRSVAAGHHAKLTIYYDFGSPWSYVTCCYMNKFLQELEPIHVETEWVPISAGAIFKSVSTAVRRLNKLSPATAQATRIEMQEYLRYRGDIPLRPNSNFPVNTLTALRAIIVKNDHKLRRKIFDALWVEDRDVSVDSVLAEVIEEVGLDSKEILSRVKDQDIKLKLKDNVDRALRAGVFGVPSFQLNDGLLIFGQDRLNVIADMICGWKYTAGNQSRL